MAAWTRSSSDNSDAGEEEEPPRGMVSRAGFGLALSQWAWMDGRVKRRISRVGGVMVFVLMLLLWRYGRDRRD